MKKVLRPLLLLMALTALLSVSVFADDTGTGFYDIGKADNVTVTPDVTQRTDAVWAGAEKPSALYNGSQKLTVKLTGAVDGCFYTIFAIKYDENEGDKLLPTQDNLFYIDQATKEAANSEVTFNVFPKDGLAADGQRQKVNLFITSSDKDFEQVRIPVNYANNVSFTEPEYLLGDINDDGEIDPTDALWALQGYVTSRTLTETQKKAADVDKDEDVTPTDALWILQRYVTVRNENWEKVK